MGGTAFADAAHQGFELDIQAINAWITPDGITLSGAHSLTLVSSLVCHITSNLPVGLHVEFASARLTLRADTPDGGPATVTVTQAHTSTSFVVDNETPTTIELSTDGYSWLGQHVQQELDRLAASLIETNAAESALVAQMEHDLVAQFQTQWTFAKWTLIPERLRYMTVAADPPPLDGFPEQLIDTRLPELRESWAQWPDVDLYTVTVSVRNNTKVEHIELVGDSIGDPFLHTFCPLPSDIEVIASCDGFRGDQRSFNLQAESGIRQFTRYRGQLDDFETRHVTIGETLRQVRITIPRARDRRPLVLHQIEIYGSRRETPSIAHLTVADLRGNGSPNVIAVSTNNEMVVLAHDGTEQWRTRLSQTVTHLSCHDCEVTGSSRYASAR